MVNDPQPANAPRPDPSGPPSARPERDALEAADRFLSSLPSPVEWVISDGLTGYAEAVAEMESRVAQIALGTACERVWLVEHPPLYTAGTSANPADLLTPGRFPVFATGRGGEYTYHGPGQRVAYVMLDLKRRRQDVRRFIAALEAWIIAALWRFAVRGMRREDRVGVWVSRPDRPEIAPGIPAEDKIAAIGIRLRKWVSFHGVSLNVDPDLTAFDGIVPCGIRDYGVTSLWDLGHTPSPDEVDMALKASFAEVFAAPRGAA